MSAPVRDPYLSLFRVLPQPVVLCRVLRDAAGGVVDLELVDANAAAVLVAEQSVEQLRGRGLRDLHGMEAAQAMLPAAGAALDTWQPQSLSITFPWGVTYDITALPLEGDEVCFTAIDVTTRRAADDARHDAEERLERAMAVVKDGVVVHDATGVIVAANPVAGEILGVRIDELTGLTSMDSRWQATNADGSPMPGEKHPAMITLRTGLACRDVPMNLSHADGRRIWIMTTTEPLRDRSGSITGVMASFTDVTEEMATGAELQVVHERYRSTLQQIRQRDQELQQRTVELETARRVAKLGFWRTDLHTGVTVWSPELFRMGGFEPAEGGLVRPEILAEAFPPEIAAERDAFVLRGITTDLPWEQTLQVTRPGGEQRWILINGMIERDVGGNPVAATGTAMDVTDQTVARLALAASEIQLRERNAQLEEARRIAGLGTWFLDARDDSSVWSPELYWIAGLDPDGPPLRPSEIDAMSDPEVVVERQRLVVESALSGEPFEQEYQLHLPGREDGGPWWWIRGVGEKDQQGIPYGAAGIAMDVSTRKRAELALRASEEALRQRTAELEEARDVAGLGVWRQDVRTRTLSWSPQLLRIFGIDDPGQVPPDEWARRTIFGLENADRLTEAAAESARTGRTVELELAIHRIDGELRWVQQRIRTEPDADGSPGIVTGTVIDITDRKLTEIALRDSEEELRQRTEELEEARRVAGLGVWSLDLVEERGTWSAEMYRLFGLDPDAPIPDAEALKPMLGEDVRARVADLTLHSARTGETWGQEVRVVGADGVERWMLHHGVTEVDAHGRPVEIHGTAQDITERKRAQLALEASEARFRSVLDNLVEGAALVAPDWTLLYSNPAFAQVAGAAPAQLIGRSMRELQPAALETPFFLRLDRAMREREPDRFEAPYPLPDRPETWIEFSLQPVPEGLFVLGLDITARHMAESMIAERGRREQERMTRLEEAGRMARLGIWRRDLIGRQTTWSPEMYELFEVEPGEPALSPDAVDALLTPASREQRRHIASTATAAGVPWEVELELRLPSGTRKWVLQHGVAETDATGAIVAYRGTALDITERKRTEQGLRRFSEMLEQRVSERTAELEAANEELRSFSYTISHDLRGPVRAVAGFARILERDYGAQLDERALHSLMNIKTAGEAMGRLIDDLLAYTRVGRSAVRHEPVPILPIAKRLAATFMARAEERGGTIEVIEPMAVPVADPTLLEELLINLVDNALNYGRPGVPPVIRIAAACHDDVVTVSVSDNGVGIPPEMRERIFEVFTRLPGTDAEKGTGIGLAIVRKAARSMGSDVTVQSEVGAGTTFSVALPCADPGAEDC